MESQLADLIEIKSPGQFYAVVKSLKEFMAAGLISEVSGNCRLSDIQKGKPWPNDFIEIGFIENATKFRFKLLCETYHGCGGTFERLL